MITESFYVNYVFVARIAILFVNLFIFALFLKAYLRHREQLGFFILAMANLGFFYTTAYHFCSSLQHRLNLEIFSLETWRILAWVFFTIDPVAIILCLIGSLVLVRSYGQSLP